MKKFLIIFFCAYSIFINAQSDPNLKWLHPSPQGWDIKWIKMWDANNWYLAGQYGTFMKTTDAGQTWTTNNKPGWPNSAYPNTLTNWHVNGGWFFNQNDGIMVGSNTAGIAKTTDGGETFDTLQILPSGTGSLYNAYFVNSNLGFICGTSIFTIQKTTDGGDTWDQLPNLDAITYYDVYATDELNIIACATAGQIYKTTNGGASWNIIPLGSPFSLTDLEFINSTTGYVAGEGGFFRYTTNAGLNWTGTDVPMNYVSAKLIANSGDVYFVGHPTNLYKSTDNGSSWSTITMTSPGNFSNLNYCGGIVGSEFVVAGGLGNIYKSTNSGTSWNNFLDRVTDCSFIRSIYVENTSGKIIATGRWSDAPGSIIISDDGGNTWTASPFISGQLTMFTRMQMFDNARGYFTGNGGFFAKTEDGGLNLTPITIPFADQNILQNLSFIDQSTGWVVGGLPFPVLTSIVAKTTDGGASWINQTPAGLIGVQLSVDFLDANVGFFGGAALYKTTNGGTNWSTITIPGASDIRDIKAFDVNNIYVISSEGTSTSGKLFKTSNGGTSWTQVTLPLDTDLFGQVWMDMNNGFITATLGLVLLTNDGGTTWDVMNTGGWTAYGGHMVSPDTFYVTSGNGQVFKYDRPSTQTTFQLSVDVANGWNMVSAPGLNSPDQNVNTWWPNRDLGANVFKYLGGYQSVTDAMPGVGYWMKNAGASIYNTGDEWPASGIQIVTHNPLTGATGWNMIGGYELSVLTANIITIPSGLQSGSVFKYSNGYQVATTLDPGYGYWIKLTGSGQIIIPESPAKNVKPAEYINEDWGKIVITDAAGINYTLYAVKGEVDLDQYELPPAPPAGMFDIRFSSGRIAEDLSNSQSIEMQGIAYPVKIRVENMNIKMMDETGKEIYDQLKPGEEITLDNSANNKFTVLSGEVITPIDYALEQNYPNPFNPSTVISFSIPQSSNVILSVFNIIGERVATLVNEVKDAGTHSVEFNAVSLSSGIYIYRLEAGHFNSVKKMMLVK